MACAATISARKAQGLCSKCGSNPARPGKSYCAACAKTDAKRNKNRRNDYISRNICWSCKTRPCAANKKTCSQCLRGRQDKRSKLRNEVLEEYGGAVCSCCGEKILEFLQIDHIEGGGKEHLKSIGTSGLYRWLKANKFPAGFQVLCANCNFAKGIYGICPHRRNLDEIIDISQPQQYDQ